MRVSIGIPCYNQAVYLPDAIESALAQTVPCEIIVVNDGSPDFTKDIAEKYEGFRLLPNNSQSPPGTSYYYTKVINQVNKGLASARNTAIMNMTGDVFLPLDADDILMENCVEKILQRFEETDADIVAPSLKCFGVGGDVQILMENPKIEDFRTGNRIGYFSAIKKEALLECGGYSPRMTWGYEDYHLWFDLLSRGKKISVIQEPLVLYRTKQVSMMKDAIAHHKELMEQIYKDFPDIWPKELAS